MGTSRKILPAAGIGLLLVAILVASLWPHRGEISVEVERVKRQNLVSTVRATGEILPVSYTNVLGQGYGRVTRIFVHEGEFVEPGDVLLELDSVQAAATVRADQAALAAAQASLAASQAAARGAQAVVTENEASMRKTRFDWEQGQKLYQAKVISRQAFESYRSAFQAAEASLAAAQAQLASAHSQQLRLSGTIRQLQATLAHDQDLLNKTLYRAPIPGTVTNIAVRVGENVIPGVPETPGAYLMTIANLSKMIAEVRVDENDITLLHAGQPVSLEIDAYPGRTFPGKVIDVGAQAILTETGEATSQVVGGGSAMQATAYLADVSIGDLPAETRPGMTVATVIQTASKQDVIAVPFQALVLRPKSEAGRTSLPTDNEAGGPVEIAASPQPQSVTAQTASAGAQGVFVVRDGRAVFTPTKIGVLGDNAVETLSGVQPGDEVVVGGFGALAELQSGMEVKIVKRAE